MADAIRSKVIRADVVSAYSHCPRKAFLLHCTEERGTPHEYQVILEEHTNVSRTSYLAALQQTSTSIRFYKDGTISSGVDVFTEAINGEARNREPDKILEVRWFRTDEIPGNLAKTAKNAIRSYLGQPLLTTRR